jgi:hypothetical protein
MENASDDPQTAVGNKHYNPQFKKLIDLCSYFTVQKEMISSLVLIFKFIECPMSNAMD